MPRVLLCRAPGHCPPAATHARASTTDGAQLHPGHPEPLRGQAPSRGKDITDHQVRSQLLQLGEQRGGHVRSPRVQPLSLVGVIVLRTGSQSGQLDPINPGAVRRLSLSRAGQQHRFLPRRLQAKAQRDGGKMRDRDRSGNHGDAHPGSLSGAGPRQR